MRSHLLVLALLLAYSWGDHVVGIPEAGPHDDDHKELFPLDVTDYLGFFLGAVGLIIAAGGGIGGGGILVPLFILVMDFHPRRAIPLSNITILGGAIANCLLNIPKRHPVADRPMIDFDLVLVMEPLTITGAVIGSILNKVTPEILITLMLVITLGFTSKKTWEKGFKTYAKEHALATGIPLPENYRAASTSEAEEKDENTSLLSGSKGGGHADTESMSWSAGEIVPEGCTESQWSPDECARMIKEIQEDERSFPPRKVATLVLCFTSVAILNLMKGTKAHESPLGVVCGSVSYWFLNLAVIPITLLIAVFVRRDLLRTYHIKSQIGYEYTEGDVRWNNRSTVLYPVVCALAGLCAGLFGIGGGIVKGPLMLEMGVLPAVSSATAAFMILFTAASASICFVVFGMLQMDYAVPLFIMGFVCTYAGQIVIDYVVKKYNNSGYIIFSIASVITLSTALMGYEGFIAAFSEESRTVHAICE